MRVIVTLFFERRQMSFIYQNTGNENKWHPYRNNTAAIVE